jgi:putative tricarboxylic transport membrane protein
MIPKSGFRFSEKIMLKQMTLGGKRAMRIRLTQDVVAGAAVISLAAAILLGLSKIPKTSYQAIAPDLFPRLCAYGLIIGGIALLVRGFRTSGFAITLPALRPTVLVVVSVVLFGLLTPVIGYGIAGFLTLMIGGLGSPEVKVRQLLVFSIGLMVFSVLLFSFVLKLPTAFVILPGIRF